jgi:hypothetical protein
MFPHFDKKSIDNKTPRTNNRARYGIELIDLCGFLKMKSAKMP